MNKGLTLTELLVSTILIGIVMVGISAFSVFVKQARDSMTSGSLLAMQTATAMHYMMEDAMKAVGDNLDRGVRVYQSGTSQSICFRQDVNNPASYADDIWTCYYHGNSLGINRYYNVDSADVPCTGVGYGCATYEAPILWNLVTVQPGGNGNGEFFQVIDDADGRFKAVDITLNTIANPDQPAHTISNPTYQLFTRISPPAHGR